MPCVGNVPSQSFPERIDVFLPNYGFERLGVAEGADICAEGMDQIGDTVAPILIRLDGHGGGRYAGRDPRSICASNWERAWNTVGSTTERVAVIVGPHGPGRWQEMEYYAAIQKYVEERDEEGRRKARVIPVLLPGAPRKPKVPVFLRGLDYVDLQKDGFDDRHAMRRLVEVILSDRMQWYV